MLFKINVDFVLLEFKWDKGNVLFVMIEMCVYCLVILIYG